MLSKKKKVFIILGFSLLLIATGVLNIVLNKNLLTSAKDDGTTVTVGNFFSTYRTDRTETREQEILYLDAIIDSASSSAEAITKAETKRQDLIELMDAELIIEGLIKAKGFGDAIVSTSSSAINVIIKSAELTVAEVAQIVDIIQSQTAYTLDNMKIIPVA